MGARPSPLIAPPHTPKHTLLHSHTHTLHSLCPDINQNLKGKAQEETGGNEAVALESRRPFGVCACSPVPPATPVWEEKAPAPEQRVVTSPHFSPCLSALVSVSQKSAQQGKPAATLTTHVSTERHGSLTAEHITSKYSTVHGIFFSTILKWVTDIISLVPWFLPSSTQPEEEKTALFLDNLFWMYYLRPERTPALFISISIFF